MALEQEDQLPGERGTPGIWEQMVTEEAGLNNGSFGLEIVRLKIAGAILLKGT
jgi:hypothetical protein